jgi:hypothetical protein
MATIGQALTAPEAGWRRYDDTDSRFVYGAEAFYSPNNSDYYNNGVHYLNNNGHFVSFRFFGKKLRIITAIHTNQSNNMKIIVDGSVKYYSAYAETLVFKALGYEMIFDNAGIHTVEIYNEANNTESSHQALFDAIDIDEDGELLPPEELEQALLRVTLNDSSEREYELSVSEINGFINWFNKHTSTDDGSFVFNKVVGSQKSKEYLAFNKIISFEVMPLTK